jgi:branched-chain amino acid transport system permease protein
MFVCFHQVPGAAARVLAALGSAQLGPVLGAAVIVTMQNYLANLGSLVSIVMGATFVVCVLLFRRGIVGEIAHRWGKKA